MTKINNVVEQKRVTTEHSNKYYGLELLAFAAQFAEKNNITNNLKIKASKKIKTNPVQEVNLQNRIIVKVVHVLK